MTILEATNKALGFLGVAPISSVSQDTHNARVMSRLFENSRKAVLSDFPWKFALKTKKLTPLTTNPALDWPYSFTLPTRTNVWGVFTPDYRDIEYYIESNVLYACEPVVICEYSIDVAFDSWDPATQEVFCYKLAADGAAVLTGSEQIAQAMLQKYVQLSSTARRNSRNERDTDRVHSGNYLRVRGFGARG